MAFGTTEYPNQFKRQDSFSLDKSSKYKTYAEAKAYAATSPIAFNLQIIGVDENDTLYVLVPSNIDGENYMLVPFDSLFTNYLKYEIGSWALTTRIEGVTAAFNFDIKYPVEATHYRVYINDKDISGQLIIGDTFVTAPVMFEEEGAKISVALERIDDSNVTTELLKAHAITVHNNSFVTMGILTTFEI